MIEIGKHLFIFLYILSFLIGITNITLNQFFISKTRNSKYSLLKKFYFTFFIHLITNFIYFYKAYFIGIWEWKIVILTAINSSIVLSVYFGINFLASFKVLNSFNFRHSLILGFGFIYVMTYAVVRSHHIGATVSFDDLTSAFLFISTNFAFTVIGLWYSIRISICAKSATSNVMDKKLINTITVSVSCYLIFNFLIDIYYGNVTDKLLLCNVNAYHLAVLIYLAMNLFILYVYINKFKESLLSEKKINDDTATTTGEPLVLSTVSIDEIIENYNLTIREKQLIPLVYLGHSNLEIANLLFISENTVKRHLTSIYKKMRISNRAELIRLLKPYF